MTHGFVVCAYQKSPYLETCIRSLKNQTVAGDICVVTSTPSDYIDRIAKRCGVPVYVRDGESSLKEDWRFALKVGGREHSLVTIAHQDDIYGRDYRREVLLAAERYADMTVFGSDYVVLKTKEQKAGGVVYPVQTKTVAGDPVRLVKKLLRFPLRFRELADRTSVKKSALMFGNSICCPSCTYNLELIGDDMFQADYTFALDWDNLLWLSSRPGRFVICERPLMAYRVHDSATTKECIGDERRSREEMDVYRKLWPEWAVGLLMHFYKKAYKAYE